MFIKEGEEWFTFSKPTTWEAVRASHVRLLAHPGADLAALPLRVVCGLSLAENHEGNPCIRIDYYIEARWCPPGAHLGWHGVTDTLCSESDERVKGIFAETAEEALVIDGAIEKILGLAPGTVAVPPSPAVGGAA